MELEFVLGVSMGRGTALLVKEAATKRSVKLSAHAPYFINLNAREEAKLTASKQRILQTARVAAMCGGGGIVFHSAFYLGDPPEEVYLRVKKALEEVTDILHREGNTVLIRPETSGKQSQFGTLEEVLQLSAEVPGVAPCIDFSHLHARSGKVNTYQEFSNILKQVKDRLGSGALERLHLHVSGISYGKRGERKHEVLQESDFNYAGLLQALKDSGCGGEVICESPNLEDDALLLQQTYKALSPVPGARDE